MGHDIDAAPAAAREAFDQRQAVAADGSACFRVPANRPIYFMALDAQGRALCAFMSRHRVYWSVLSAGGSAFLLHVATPGRENDEIYPLAVANRKGEVLLVRLGSEALARVNTTTV